MSKMEAVLFDVDGTLLDSYRWIESAFEYSLKTHGYNFNQSCLRQLLGQPLHDIYNTLVPDGDVDDLCSTHINFHLCNQTNVKTFSGTVDILKQLKFNGIKLGVVTNRWGWLLSEQLDQAGISEYLDLAVTKLDVSCCKPDPEGINKSLRWLGLKPEQACMVGDTRTDVLAGKQAGVTTVALLGGRFCLASELYKAEADYTIRNRRLLPVLIDSLG